jgi:hypothetical protein
MYFCLSKPNTLLVLCFILGVGKLEQVPSQTPRKRDPVIPSHPTACMVNTGLPTDYEVSSGSGGSRGVDRSNDGDTSSGSSYSTQNTTGCGYTSNSIPPLSRESSGAPPRQPGGYASHPHKNM